MFSSFTTIKILSRGTPKSPLKLIGQVNLTNAAIFLTLTRIFNFCHFSNCQNVFWYYINNITLTSYKNSHSVIHISIHNLYEISLLEKWGLSISVKIKGCLNSILLVLRISHQNLFLYILLLCPDKMTGFNFQFCHKVDILFWK